MKCVKRRLTKRIDKTYNDKFYKTNKKLMDILSEGEQWGHKPANQEYAKEKVKEFLEDSTIEENRIAAEVTLYADKIAVDEEIVRLQSHISSMTDVLESDESIGRKLDFMAQEMNREANTILSKSSDVDLADHAIELKTNVEKVREQIQNIE